MDELAGRLYKFSPRHSRGATLETLENFLAEFEAGFDVKDDGGFMFDYGTLPDPPDKLKTDALVICKAVRLHNNIARIDGLWFYGTQRTYRLLGLLILATLFSRSRTKTVLSLTHPKTTIRELIVEAPRPDKNRLGSAGLNMVPPRL